MSGWFRLLPVGDGEAVGLGLPLAGAPGGVVAGDDEGVEAVLLAQLGQCDGGRLAQEEVVELDVRARVLAVVGTVDDAHRLVAQRDETVSEHEVGVAVGGVEGEHRALADLAVDAVVFGLVANAFWVFGGGAVGDEVAAMSDEVLDGGAAPHVVDVEVLLCGAAPFDDAQVDGHCEHQGQCGVYWRPAAACGEQPSDGGSEAETEEEERAVEVDAVDYRVGKVGDARGNPFCGTKFGADDPTDDAEEPGPPGEDYQQHHRAQQHSGEGDDGKVGDEEVGGEAMEVVDD